MLEFKAKLTALQFRDGVVDKPGQIEAKAKEEVVIDAVKRKFEREQKQNGMSPARSLPCSLRRRPEMTGSRSP